MDIDLSRAWETIQGMVDGMVASLPNVLIAIAVFVAFLFVARWVRALVRRLTRRIGRRENVGRVVGRLAQWAVLLLGALIAMSVVMPNFDAADLLAVLGIGGVAVGFAFKDIFQNFLAGLLILLTEPFRIGDQIEVSGFEGTVENIETRATTIKTYDHRVVVIPNSTLYTESVVVNTAYDKRRSHYDVGIGYGDDIRRAKELMIEAMKGVDGVLSEPAPSVRTAELADSSVNLRARWWTASVRSEVSATRDRVITAIKERLDEGGVEIPFPVRTVLLHPQQEES